MDGTESAQTRLQAIVHGRVQGVNFRYYTRRRATELGVTGFVRNLWDRTVEVVAEGRRTDLESLLSFLHVGPPAALVTKVDASWATPTGKFNRFEVRY